MNRRNLFVALGLLVSVIFLWQAFRGLDPSAVWENIAGANVWLLLLAMAVYGLAVVIISLRWQFLLRAFQPVPLRKLVPLVAIGYMGNNIYPFRSGEILRIYLLRRDHGIAYARGATTVVVERVFDGLVMLTFVILPVVFLGVASEDVRRVMMVAAPIFLSALVVFFVLAARPTWLRGLASWAGGWLPGKVGEIVVTLGDDISDGLAGLRSPVDLAGAVISSYATWMVEALVYWIVAMAFGLGVGYPLMLLTVGVVNLAGLLPASPGQFGVFEYFVRAVVTTAGGVAVGAAAAYAIVVHMVIWLPPTIAGLIFLVREGLSLNAISRAQDLQRTVADANA